MTDKELEIRLYQAVLANNPPRVYNNWHASSIGDCPRSHYFKRVGVPPVNEMSGALQLRFEVGHKMEEAIRPYLEEYYPELVSNERITSTELDLTGEFDAYDPESKSIIEVKSVHPYALKYLEKEGKPHLHYQYQNHAYKLLLAEGDNQVDYIYYLYLALDGRIKVFKTEPDPTIEAQVKKRLEVLRTAWETKTPPSCFCGDKEHPLFKPVMRYCSYQQKGKDCCSIDLLDKFNNKAKGENNV